ncbi:hypothetical protein B0T16DRAFT_414333 [Cercophora newfieldiana]|uniref:Uncharacterized protein n=1 Tax=Cercophora newfieldiana TaxID=92897 RepID=A0AA39Y8G3_9PEZI|nr:hypothetical protein B0T16DRAFT_414333 [Cercophora newfieldiana]
MFEPASPEPKLSTTTNTVTVAESQSSTKSTPASPADPTHTDTFIPESQLIPSSWASAYDLTLTLITLIIPYCHALVYTTTTTAPYFLSALRTKSLILLRSFIYSATAYYTSHRPLFLSLLVLLTLAYKYRSRLTPTITPFTKHIYTIIGVPERMHTFLACVYFTQALATRMWDDLRILPAWVRLFVMYLLVAKVVVPIVAKVSS